MKTKTSKKILIIEDEMPYARALKLKLEDSGFLIDIVTTGSEAIAALHRTLYQVILLDLILPQIDGFGILDDLESHHNKTPVIVLSNLSQPEDMDKAKQYGVKRFFIKSQSTLESIARAVKELATP